MGDRLAGKVALITGGSKGQGAAEARRFVAEGAKVAITDIDDDNGEALAAELGDDAFYRHLEVSDAEQWDAAVAATVDTYGVLHILINNAGIGGAPTNIEEVTLEFHRHLIDINLHGVFMGMRAAKPEIAETGNGAIVNISSIDGIAGVLGNTSYVASKFAVTGMTKSAALEMGPLGIRVNSIHPGFINSFMVQQAPPEVTAKFQKLMDMQPIKRMGEPDEVANLALFLASDEASYITGTQIVIDGGHLAGPWRESIDIWDDYRDG